MKLLIFDKEKIIKDVDLNKDLKLESTSYPLPTIPNPFGVCCFLDKNRIFYAFYYESKEGPDFHTHLIYDMESGFTKGCEKKEGYEEL